MFPRLYPILDVEACRAHGIVGDDDGALGLQPLAGVLAVADEWLDAGVRLFQLRAKDLPSGPFLDLASALAARARQAGATFIVNDRADIVMLSGADGVHVGQDDLTPRHVRAMLPASAIVGLSTHSDEQVERALAEPVSYLAIGPVFATTSKAKPDPVVGLEGVRRAREIAGDLPLVAIGGITLERAPSVLAAGASSVAVISDLLGVRGGERLRAYLGL